MKEFVSHFSAAYQWNIPYLDSVLGTEYIAKYHNNNDVDITVTSPKLKYKKNGRVTHLCEKTLPRGAVIKHGENFIASPELVFLELANILDVHRLILLGLQMCAHPPGKTSKSISSKRKIEAFLQKTPNWNGVQKANHAIKYVANSSASIMESIVYMILTLPHSLGGFGLKGALLNHGFSFARNNDSSKRYNSEKKMFRQEKYFVDLFYKSAKLAIEYDSLKHHSTPSEQGKDFLRASTLEHMGISSMRLSTVQLYDKAACTKFALNLASRLQKRIQIRTNKFELAHENLRKLLPSKK